MTINNSKDYTIQIAEVTTSKGKTYKAVLINGEILTFDRLVMWKIERYSKNENKA